MTTTIIQLASGTTNDRSYGITHRSASVYRVTGRGVHSRSYPHRVRVWDNARRPNPRNGEPVRWGDYGPIDGGSGKYLDPHNRATDKQFTYDLSAEPVAITSNGTNTGTVASGQVYSNDVLTIGQFVVLRYPDGALSDPFRLTARPLSDPALAPLPAEVIDH